MAESIGRRVFPSFEAGLIGSLIAGDLPYYDSRIHAHAVASMNGFAKSVGLLDDVSVPYETIVATEFASLWSAADR